MIFGMACLQFSIDINALCYGLFLDLMFITCVIVSVLFKYRRLGGPVPVNRNSPNLSFRFVLSLHCPQWGWCFKFTYISFWSCCSGFVDFPFVLAYNLFWVNGFYFHLIFFLYHMAYGSSLCSFHHYIIKDDVVIEIEFLFGDSPRSENLSQPCFRWRESTK